MAYPQHLLGEGETIAFEMKPHWRALVWPIILLLLVVFGATFLGTWLFGSLGGFFGDVGGWIVVAIAVILFFGWVLRPFLNWLTSQYVFTNRRIITRKGFIAKKGRDMPLSKVNNVEFEVPLMGRILNYGRLVVESASTDGDLVIDDVPDVEHIQREVYRLHEEDDERRRRRSSQLGGDPVPPNDGT